MSLTQKSRSLKERAAFKQERKTRRHLNEYLRSNRVFSKQKSEEINSSVFLALCESVDSPVSLGAWLRFSHGELYELVTMEIDALHYSDVRRFEGDYLCVSFFSKYADFNLGVDRKEAALGKWLDAELACGKVNASFRSRWAGDPISWSPSVSAVYHRACTKVAAMLGDVPNHVLEHGRFGPGADMSTRGTNVSRYYKYASSGTCTPGVLTLIERFNLDDVRADIIHGCEFVNESRLDFVPKTAKIDRAICVEPRWNIFFQLSVAHVMQGRLARFGFDITDQSRNQALASNALKLGLATIDLSSASDCIAKNLVLDMLPEAWADLLFLLRCPITRYKGKRYLLEKISSMGNGYTFPLETAIFGAFALAACEQLGLSTENVSVYGDDIIVPKEAAPLLIEMLAEVGFKVNTKKSFISGVFFESCGSDYFMGKNVRPIFLKGRVSNVERAYRLANQITEFARRRNGYRDACSSMLAAWDIVVSHIPEGLRLFGSVGTGDGTIHAPFDRALPVVAGSLWDSAGWEGYYLWGLSVEPVRFSRFGGSLLHSKLDGPDFVGNFVAHRRVTRTSVERILVHKFEDFLVV